MKIFLRILVILIIGGLFFLGGFMLGSKDTSSTVDTETLPTEAPKLDISLPGTDKKTSPEEAKTETEPQKPGEVNSSGPEASPETKETEAPEELAKLPEAPKLPALAGKEPVSKDEASPPVAKQTAASKPEENREDAKIPEGTTKKPGSEDKLKTSEKPVGEVSEKKDELMTPLSAPNRMGYSIEVGSFLERELAEERVAELNRKEYSAFIVSTWDSHRQLWHTVRVGNYSDLIEARLAARDIQEKERINAHVFGIGTIRFDDLPVEEKSAALPAEQQAKADPAPANNKEPLHVP